ncbi:hypothetical protein HBB16_21390 [Pseudonocardia sp. MCCB 268]|nr:hypothetical protein [Pseudonocardia cytotoxica]
MQGLVVANVAVFVLTVVTAGSLNGNLAPALFAEGALGPRSSSRAVSTGVDRHNRSR